MISNPKPIGVCEWLLHNDHSATACQYHHPHLSVNAPLLLHICECPSCTKHVGVCRIGTQQLLKTTPPLTRHQTIQKHPFSSLFNSHRTPPALRLYHDSLFGDCVHGTLSAPTQKQKRKCEQNVQNPQLRVIDFCCFFFIFTREKHTNVK